MYNVHIVEYNGREVISSIIISQEELLLIYYSSRVTKCTEYLYEYKEFLSEEKKSGLLCLFVSFGQLQDVKCIFSKPICVSA